MNTTTSTVLTAVIVTTGQWSQGKSLSIRIFVGMGMVAIFLAVIAEADAEMAQKFGALILIAAVFLYGPSITKKLGFTK